jgi:ParB-like chromosome segregation protein Spo0J
MTTAEVVLRPVSELKPYAHNARAHSPTQINQLAASIREFGFTNPVLATGDGMIVAGHGFVEAAKAVGIETVPTIVVGADWSPAQLRAYVLADNQLALNAAWDDDLLKQELSDLSAESFDLGLIGFDPDLVAGLLAAEPTGGLTVEDEIPELPKQPATRRGDLWLLGNHRLLCGDSINPEDVISLMEGKRAALFATDPPYLVDYDGTNHPTKKGASARAKKIANKDWSEEYIEQKNWDDSSQGPQFYEAFMRVAIDCVIAEGVAWYCWHASRRQAMLEECWKKFDVLHHQQIIWAKSTAGADPLDHAVGP